MLKLFLKSRNNRCIFVPLKSRGRWPSGKETIKMPIMLTRKDGPPTPFRNAEYIPFYYFIPKSILSRCGAELNAIPRNPQELFHNRAACEFVESDLFRLLIIDAVAFMRYGGHGLLACVQKPESHAGLCRQSRQNHRPGISGRGFIRRPALRRERR